MAITWEVVDNTNRLGSNSTTSTASGVPFGTSAVDRHIVVIATVATGAGPVLSMNIAGLTTTTVGTGSDTVPSIAVAYVPAGTSAGTVTATLQATDQLFIYTVIAVYGADTGALFDTVQTNGASASLIDIATGGLIVATVASWSQGAKTWTGATEATAWRGSTGCTVATYQGAAETNRSINYGTLKDGSAAVSFSPAAASSISASATQAVPVSTSGAATVFLKASAAQSLAIGQSAAATVAVKASATQPVPIGLSATAKTVVAASSASTIAVSQAATGAEPVAAVASQDISVSQLAAALIGNAPVSALASQAIGIAQSASAAGLVSGASVLSVPLGSSAAGTAPVQGHASQSMAVAQAAVGVSVIEAIASSEIAVSQDALAREIIIPTPPSRTLWARPEVRQADAARQSRTISAAPQARIVTARG